jgi:hypothetical protein
VRHGAVGTGHGARGEGGREARGFLRRSVWGNGKGRGVGFQAWAKEVCQSVLSLPGALTSEMVHVSAYTAEERGLPERNPKIASGQARPAPQPLRDRLISDRRCNLLIYLMRYSQRWGAVQCSSELSTDRFQKGLYLRTRVNPYFRTAAVEKI